MKKNGPSIGKPWENHGETMGTWCFDGILWDLPSGNQPWLAGKSNVNGVFFLIVKSLISMVHFPAHHGRLPEGTVDGDIGHIIGIPGIPPNGYRFMRKMVIRKKHFGGSTVFNPESIGTNMAPPTWFPAYFV